MTDVAEQDAPEAAPPEAARTRRSRRVLVLTGLFIFLCGGVTGAALAKARGWGRRPRPRPTREFPDDMRTRMHEDLGIAPEQAGRIDEVMREHWAKMRALDEEMEPRRQALREAWQEEMRQTLTPEQWERWQKIWQRRHGQGPGGREGPPRHRGPGGPPPPPNAPRGE